MRALQRQLVAFLRQQPPGSTGRAGLTIIEVMLATVILAIVSVNFLQFMFAGDRVRVRGQLVDTATLLARNEAERMKSVTGMHTEVGDSVYEMTIANRSFMVERQVVERDRDSLPDCLRATRQISIAVRLAEQDTALVQVYLLVEEGLK